MPDGSPHRLGALFLLAAGLAAPASAAPPPAAAASSPAQASAIFAARAGDLVGLVNGDTPPERIFSPQMLAAVPAARLTAVAADLRNRYGRALRVDHIESASPVSGLVALRLEHAMLRLTITVAPQPPGQIIGLVVSGIDLDNDNPAAIAAALKALPGEAAMSVATLGGSSPAPSAALAGDRAMAIGSAFKLFVLAELAREVKAGERHWADVVPLAYRSLPSGLLQDWPQGSPITLHSLAALMISRSDNSAADTLLHLLGREKVEQLLPALGVGAAARDRPLLSTREAFAVKADSAALERWRAGDEAARRAMLPALDSAEIDPASLAGGPHAIDSVEWFASTDDLVRTLDWLRRNADPTALAILAINPGLAQAKDGFVYAGYKGGSEPGVIAMAFLLRRRDGSWRAVAGIWNDPAAPVDESRFEALMGRLVALQR
ncbi:MAG TPA: serine hydrolase [Allosphingosinicella sp.]|nr:serine hydrolase [Allosphingosinicella sp.]